MENTKKIQRNNGKYKKVTVRCSLHRLPNNKLTEGISQFNPTCFRLIPSSGGIWVHREIYEIINENYTYSGKSHLQYI